MDGCTIGCILVSQAFSVQFPCVFQVLVKMKIEEELKLKALIPHGWLYYQMYSSFLGIQYAAPQWGLGAGENEN